MKILNEDEVDGGRRMDMLSKTKYNDTVIEVCSTEFKKLNASTTLCIQQQSKNIRINSAIAYNIHNVTKERARHRIHGLERTIWIYGAHQVDSLYIPKLLLELDNFRFTLKRL